MLSPEDKRVLPEYEQWRNLHILIQQHKCIRQLFTKTEWTENQTHTHSQQSTDDWSRQLLDESCSRAV